MEKIKKLGDSIHQLVLDLISELYDVDKVFCSDEELEENYDQILDCPFCKVPNLGGDYTAYHIMNITKGEANLIELENESRLVLSLGELDIDALLMISSRL